MSCSFTEQVSCLIDGELPEAEARNVERHLLECADCQLVRADFLNLRSEISSFETNATLEVQSRALAKILTPAESKVRKVRSAWTFGPVAAAFATLLLVTAIVAVYFLQRRETDVPDRKVASAGPTPVVTSSPEPTPTPAASPKSQEKTPKSEPSKQPSSPSRRVTPPRDPKPGEQFAALPDPVRSADPQTMTAIHFEKTELLLRGFRNLRIAKRIDIGYEKKRAQQLVYQNMMLRREADTAGDVQNAALLESVEPILIDIANLPDKAGADVVRTINERVQRKNIVALLQVNSAALARALD